MNKTKIFKIVLLGNLLINLPILGSAIYFLINGDIDKLFLIFLKIALFGSIYWAFVTSWFRKYAIKHLNNKEEYFLWKKWSVCTLIL